MRSFYKFLIVIVIIVFGAAIFAALVKTRPKAEHRPVSISSPLVEVIRVNAGQSRIIVHATGIVIPKHRISLQAQVSGVVVWQNPGLVPGAMIKKGEELVRIDPRDYELAVIQQRANLTKARVGINTEKGRVEVARREWDLLGGDMDVAESGRDLALRKPQLKDAKAVLAAAQSALEKAELNLGRTTIRAPFDAVVLSENVDNGQLVSPGATIAVLAGSTAFWVQAKLPYRDLAWIDIPGADEAQGSAVRVCQGPGGQFSHTGVVERLLAEVDPRGRMARLLIGVPSPLLPMDRVLLLGSYVTLEIEGKEVKDVYEIPEEALQEGDCVWLLGDDNTLEIRDVQVIRAQCGKVLVQGLKDNERVICSRISVPVSGMALRGMALRLSKADR